MGLQKKGWEKVQGGRRRQLTNHPSYEERAAADSEEQRECRVGAPESSPWRSTQAFPCSAKLQAYARKHPEHPDDNDLLG